jgi:hypothetical protein
LKRYKSPLHGLCGFLCYPRRLLSRQWCRWREDQLRDSCYGSAAAPSRIGGKDPAQHGGVVPLYRSPLARVSSRPRSDAQSGEGAGGRCAPTRLSNHGGRLTQSALARPGRALRWLRPSSPSLQHGRGRCNPRVLAWHGLVAPALDAGLGLGQLARVLFAMVRRSTRIFPRGTARDMGEPQKVEGLGFALAPPVECLEIICRGKTVGEALRLTRREVWKFADLQLICLGQLPFGIELPPRERRGSLRGTALTWLTELGRDSPAVPLPASARPLRTAAGKTVLRRVLPARFLCPRVTVGRRAACGQGKVPRFYSPPSRPWNADSPRVLSSSRVTSLDCGGLVGAP